MQVAQRLIESNLPSKGFAVENTHHKYFHHEYQGKRTGVYTYVSQGNRTCGNPLLVMMKKQLKLNSISEVLALFNCPMSEDSYNQILISKGFIPNK